MLIEPGNLMDQKARIVVVGVGGGGGNALNRMIEEGFTTLEFSKLSESQRLSNDLVRLESIAMNAVRGRFDDGTGQFNRAGEPDFELARQLMFGKLA